MGLKKSYLKDVLIGAFSYNPMISSLYFIFIKELYVNGFQEKLPLKCFNRSFFLFLVNFHILYMKILKPAITIIIIAGLLFAYIY